MPIRVLLPPRGDYQFVHVRGDLYRRVERRRVEGAYDSATSEIAVEPLAPKNITPAAAARLLQFLASKLSLGDLGRAWELIERRVDWSGHPPARRNGKAGAAITA
jgi:hypothetical protein